MIIEKIDFEINNWELATGNRPTNVVISVETTIA